MLRHHNIEISVARRGCPWENGYAERHIRTLKEEKVHLNDYEDIHEARTHIGKLFITQVYHYKRPHWALGNHLTPVEFERKTCVRSNKRIGNVVRIPLHESSNVRLTLTALAETLTWEARGNGALPRTQAKLKRRIPLVFGIGASERTHRGKRKLNA